MHSRIESAYKKAKNYPDLIQHLITLGIRSYTVDTATGTMLYRLPDGEHVVHKGSGDVREISAEFNRQATIQAIRDNQQAKTDYPGFMNAIAAAGVRFYEATLEGPNKRVTYIGSGGSYEEMIPG